MKQTFVSLLFVCLSVVGYSQKKQVKQIDKYIESSRVSWDIPGMAVAIVKDGETVLSKGYGVRNADTGEPVTSKTNFAIASNTKGFTSAALAILVDEGKLSWDDKVQDYLPYFQLYDPYVSAQITVRDLLCHRSGLETFSGDLIWYGTTYSREDVIKRAKHLEPKYGFREHYGYQNIMFIAAGEIVEAVSGQTWDAFVKTHFFEPLGMSNTITSVLDFRKGDDLSEPHNYKNGKNQVIDWVNWDNIGGAGAIISNADDVCKWLECQLNRGVFKGDTLWSEARSREMWSLHTPEGISTWSESNFPTKTFNGYGLGWELMTYHGRKVVSHGGGYDGFITKTVMVPSENLAFVILTNNINWLSSALTYSMLDMLLTGEFKKDWSQYFLEIKTKMDQEEAEEIINSESERIKNTQPTLDINEYAGIYRDRMYGDLQVQVVGDQLAFQFLPTSLFRGTFRHWHYDTFQLNWSSNMMLPSGTAQFVINPKGKVSEIQIDVPNPDFYFTELKFMKVD